MRHDRIDPGAAADDAGGPHSKENTLTPFGDRAEAGRVLADRLRPLLASPAVVAAIPRGGVAVALPIVERLQLPLTVVYARKLTAPIAPELAFGALDEDGEAILDEETVAALGLRPEDVEKAKIPVAAEIKRRMAFYQVPALAHYLPGAHVVLVDDGLATGLTMRAALAYARRHGASQITLAVPCASAQAAERFRREVDHFVSLVVDPLFMAVGTYYVDFSPVVDDAVRTMLERARQSTPGAGSPRWATRLSFKSSRGHRLAGALLLPEGVGLGRRLGSLAQTASAEETMNVRVRDVMTKNPITIDPQAPLETAAAVLREREVRHLPVVNETGRLIGMITDRDLRGALLAPALAEYLSGAAQRRLRGLGTALGNLRVRDAMTWDVVTIEPEAPIGRAAALMFEGRIGSLPVVERERLVGIVTERDVLKVLAATLPAVRGNDPDNYFW